MNTPRTIEIDIEHLADLIIAQTQVAILKECNGDIPKETLNRVLSIGRKPIEKEDNSGYQE